MDIYIDGLQNNVKLFGSTINTICNPLHLSHVQSYIFSTDKEGLDLLIHYEIFSLSNYAKDKNDAIDNKEVLMSRKILDHGWNIDSLHKYYKNVDFTFSKKKPHEYEIAFLDDIMYEQYRGKLWNDYELVFIKGNRMNMNAE